MAAALVMVAAAPPTPDRARPLSLRDPQKLTAGPLLGFVAGPNPTSAARLTQIDPRTLRPRGAKSLRLPFADAWAVSSDGGLLALAVHREPINEPNSLELVKLPSLQLQAASVRLGGDVSALAWVAPGRVAALVGRILCCPARLSAVVAEPRSGRVIRRQPLAGTVLHIARSSRGLVLLTAPTDAIARASLVVIDAHGVRSAPLDGISAGEVPGGGGISRWRLPGLAVDTAGRTAYVVDPAGSVTEIDLATLTSSDHQLRVRRSVLARLDAWLEPTAAAKGDAGPVRLAQCLGNGFLVVAGSNLHDNPRRLSSDPAGLELIDTRDWSKHNLASQVDSFTIADGLLLATGARWRGNLNPTGMGLAAYGSDGRLRFELFSGRDVWLDRAANGRAYVGGYGWKLERVIDLRTGRVTRTHPSNTVPVLLLGQGNQLG